MTVPSTPSEISYATDGVTDDFPITFVFDTSADIVAKLTASSGNVTPFTAFSVTGGGGSNGTLTTNSVLASGSILTIYDDPEQSQQTDYVDNDEFPAPAHERALDKVTRLVKRLSQRLTRSLHAADGDPISDLTLGSVDNRKGKYLFFNAVTGAIEYAVALVTTTLSQSIIAQLLNPQTAGEAAAGVTPTNYWYLPGDVRRYGAVGNGVTDATAAIQNAINAAGVAGEVIFPAIGVFLCTGSLTGLNFQTWRGSSYELGAGGSQASLKCTKTNGTFITTGSNQKFENIRFLGVVTYTDATGAVADSTAIGMQLTDSVTFRDCVFQLQFHCIQSTTGAYYIRMYGGEVTRCGLLLNMRDADVFNAQIDGTIFRLCSTITASNDTPKRYVHNLKVMGGSFESWTTLFNSIRTASFHGTYFESDIVGGVGFNNDASFVNNDTSISLFGCTVFINNLARFVNYSGLTGCTFVSIGNTIAGSVNSGQDQHYFVPQNVNTGRTVMLGDYLDDRGTGTFQGAYTSDDTKLVNQMIVWPRGTTADHSKAGQTWLVGGAIFKPSALANSATPSVKGGTNFLTGGTTTITNFTNGVEGQEIRILAEHAITITDGTNIFLAGSVNFAMNSTDSLVLICKADGKWYEIGRSDNT